MTPPRGFKPAEFQRRVAAAQNLMAQNGIDALLLTTEPDVRYFTGFLTRFWESPTRPWFVVIPSKGAPIAVIPAIGAHLMALTWITDIRTWRAPDYDDDGIGLLVDTLAECAPSGGRIALPDQMETHVRMPLAALKALEQRLLDRVLVGDSAIVRNLRMIKSDAEIAKIGTACRIAERAFDRVHEFAKIGVPLSEVFREFQALCLHEGADWVPYLAGAAGQGGYGDVISPASDTPLADGDVLMLDTGMVWEGYFCDFDRNFAVGAPNVDVRNAHDRLMEAIQAGASLARPGSTMADLFHAMNDVVNPGKTGSDAGRLGHGLGMQLTEWPSIIAADETVLVPGMVLTLEPGIVMQNDKMMVHEENIVITDGPAQFLSDFRPNQMRVL
ncbi:Xaa-Pro peptidase family protein [Rhodobacteraceae bacterium S2214]|nr:Xaa-Pro peptidase family protein [Rhodobacteraceae bacterium S2214]